MKMEKFMGLHSEIISSMPLPQEISLFINKVLKEVIIVIPNFKLMGKDILATEINI